MRKRAMLLYGKLVFILLMETEIGTRIQSVKIPACVA